MAKTYRGILIFVVILGIVMGLAGKKFDGYVYTNTEPRSNTECTLIFFKRSGISVILEYNSGSRYGNIGNAR